MLRIQSAFSGADVARIAAEEFRDLVGVDTGTESLPRGCRIRRLKQHLQRHVGKARFQQQLLLQGEILKDDEEVQPPVTLQLALLPLSEGKELLEAARREATVFVHVCANIGNLPNLPSSSDSSFHIFVDAFLNRL